MRAATRRGAEVAAVGTRHGLASLLDCLDLGVLAPRWHRSAAGRSGPVAVHLRRALEELGPTFMKLGQVLSTRPDLIPPRFEAELALLQDAGPVVPTPQILAAVEDAFGAAADQVLRRFDDVPIAAASIGQVHAATLADGREVVVKVRRPGVISDVSIDLDLLMGAAGVLARSSLVASRYDPVGLAKEFSATLRSELDYRREGRNAERIAASFANDDGVRIPEVIWELTCESVITEERLRGIKVDDLRALDAAGLDRVQIARRFANAYLSMVFVHRFFHADPHPGNVFVEPAGRIGFVDFGMVGSIGNRTRHGLSTILLALVAADAPRMADGLLGLGVASDDVDRAAFERDLAHLLERYARLPLEELRLRFLLADLMNTVRAHRLRLPSDLALLLKTVMMCEGVAARLDPKFELVPMLVPYASALVDRRDGAA
ncbi:MAG TPA: AarF/ABC1/UbiB kinase family protein [Acidimicrobiia bacterium]|nr:AarF/ABC1/UbiB kinase family protein [Acidimicrobiia bacterium]